MRTKRLGQLFCPSHFCYNLPSRPLTYYKQTENFLLQILSRMSQVPLLRQKCVMLHWLLHLKTRYSLNKLSTDTKESGQLMSVCLSVKVVLRTATG